jgi:hypothetical protein
VSVALESGWSEKVGTKDTKKIKEELLKMQDGMISSIHINLPPFTWYKALKVPHQFVFLNPKHFNFGIHSYGFSFKASNVVTT